MRKLLAAALGALSVMASAEVVEARDLVPCAGEGGYCSVPYPTRVYYGARGRYRSRDVAGGIPCSNDVFGDPIGGVHKACAYEARHGYRRHRYD